MLNDAGPSALEVEENELSPILAMCERVQLRSLFVLLCSRHCGYSVA